MPFATLMNMDVVREQKQRCVELRKRSEAEGWLKGEPHCGVIFDGILCWNVSLPDEVQTQNCPDYVYGFKTEEYATKECLAGGKWFTKALGEPWTNYSLCQSPLFTLRPEHQIGMELLERWTPVVKRMGQVGYAVSFVTLIVALFVLSAIKRLRCPRNSLHKHLFASFLLRAFVSLLKDVLFVQGLGLAADVLVDHDGSMLFFKGSNWLCKLIISLWQYVIMANYSWILMEGLYLHNLIFLALFSDTSAIRLYVVLGWGLPVLFVGPWVAARALLEDEFCWTTNNSHLFLLIRLPIVASVLVSFGLFINISRVLLTKLRFAPHLERRRVRYRRFARSTLVLVPLFGVHYTVFLAMSCGIDRYPRLELSWLICDQFFASFQGLFVALLYCLLNAEVRAELARKWGLLLNGRRRSGCGRGGIGALGGGGGGGGSGGGGQGGGARGAGVMGAIVGGWRPSRGASLSSVLTSETLVRMAELGRANGRVRTISASEDERERVRSAQA
ncbi:hypothetical protein R5R35_003386 [Gryllus longicercus]|uniref:Parathyroid hormone/parathyroid hormone-related peptide receptor n=1 Tax=Gryllus longicercus TaxID=2509291 RepID=A0AAN9W8J4_9ORTH